MTRDEMLAMPAGRELDAAIVEAMGRKVEQRICHWYPGDGFWEETQSFDDGMSEQYGSIQPCYPDGADWWKVVKQYSTDIAAAMRLLGESKGWTLSSNAFINHYKCRIHMVADEPFIGEADTAPLAICRAYLMWKAVQNGR